MTEQHDDHCWLHFKGRDWFILFVSNRAQIIIVATPTGNGGHVQVTLQMSSIDFDAYCAAAAALLDRSFSAAPGIIKPIDECHRTT